MGCSCFGVSGGFSLRVCLRILFPGGFYAGWNCLWFTCGYSLSGLFELLLFAGLGYFLV